MHTNSRHKITIQIFSPEYSDNVGKLILQIQREEFQVPITLEQQPDLSDIAGFYQTGKGISEIYLGTTDKFLAAHRFYEKNGFILIPKADLPPPQKKIPNNVSRFKVLHD